MCEFRETGIIYIWMIVNVRIETLLVYMQNENEKWQDVTTPPGHPAWNF